MNALAHPKAFGEWHVVKPLGPGGAYGITYLVRKGNDVFALKWLKPDAPREGKFRFENEIWALKKLNHPSVPRFIESGEFDGRPYIVMTFAKGQTLRQVLDVNRQEGGVFSQLKVLLIARGLLEALDYVHSNGVVHRDVKDDNVIVSASGGELTLIDFGVCKGEGAPAEGQTFWHAGASRFSPPAKLEHPTSADPGHDIFAVGVLCYLLLTNDFPWQVPQGADSGHLRQLMIESTPRPIREVNRFVDRVFSELVSDLIDIRDHVRPTAARALERIKELQPQFERKAPPAISASGSIVFGRVIRDSLHGDIPMTDYEFQIINSKEFQRLRRVRQLGFSYLVYPGAEHSRFSHAIGTMHVADKILNRIEARTGSDFDSDERLIVRTFALVHDIAHVAFGHTLEDELGFFPRHDQNESRISRILKVGGSEIAAVLESTDYGRAVLDLITGEEPSDRHSWITELIACPSGADVLDYIDRDALYCGLDHRVDSAIFRQYSIAKTAALDSQRHVVSKLYGRHGFRVDADYALLSLLRERFALFLKVYTHPTKISAGAMIGKALFESGMSEIDVERMGDDELLIALRDSDVTSSKKIAGQLLERKLFRPVYRARALGAEQRTTEQYHMRRENFAALGLLTPEGRAGLEANLASAVAIGPENVIVYATANAPGAQKVEHYVETSKGKQRFRDEIHTPHQEIFRDHLSLWNVYVLVDPDLPADRRISLAEKAEQHFRFKNEMEVHRRQLVFSF